MCVVIAPTTSVSHTLREMATPAPFQSLMTALAILEHRNFSTARQITTQAAVSTYFCMYQGGYGRVGANRRVSDSPY